MPEPANGLSSWHILDSRCAEQAEYLYEQLRRIGWYAKHDPPSSTVFLRCPPMVVCERFGLSVENNYASVSVAPNTVRPDLDELISTVEHEMKLRGFNACSQ